MHDAHASAFEAFLERHASDLSRIARASRGESEVGDIRAEAWLLAFDIGQRRGRALDLDAAEDDSLLIRHLYNHCVKYTETVVRHAQRLDHAATGDYDRDHHWLMDQLVADGGAHPLSLLEDTEAATAEPDDPDPYHSAAAAWIWLLQRFDQRMDDVAGFLLISVSWCYACCREARRQAHAQWPLPHGLSVETGEGTLRPWRGFKLPQAQAADAMRQLGFDYWSRPAQPALGQLWLL